MSRPSKYNVKAVTKFVDMVKTGYTEKAACKAIGITDMTLSRWRKRYPEFKKAIENATTVQEATRHVLKEAGVRTYKRKTDKLPTQAQKPLTSGLVASRGNYSSRDKPSLYDGLIVRFGSIETDNPYIPCINHINGMVEYLKRQGGRNIKYSCTIEVFKKHQLGWYCRLAEQNRAIRNQ